MLPAIRFINRDILDGTIDNGQSLNEYLKILGHTALDLLGFVLVVGFVADLANAYWYYRERNTFQMAASMVAAIPGFGDAVGGSIKGAGFVARCERTIKVGKAVSATCRMVGAVAQTGVNMINFDRAFRSVRQEYRENRHLPFLNGANAALSALGVVGGVAQSVNSIRSFNRMRGSLKSSKSIDNRLINNDLFNNGERVATIKQVGNYKKEMNRMGIKVVVDKKSKMLSGNKAARFDYSTETIYIKKKVGVIDLYHEGYHAEQYLNFGKKACINPRMITREEYVYGRIMEKSSLSNEAELQVAINYIMKLRRR